VHLVKKATTVYNLIPDTILALVSGRAFRLGAATCTQMWQYTVDMSYDVIRDRPNPINARS